MLFLNITSLYSRDLSSAHVFVLLTFQLKEKRRNTWLKPRNATQQEEEDSVKEGEVK